MRSAIVVAAFAAGTFAAPFKLDNKREDGVLVSTKYDVHVVTDIVYVSASELSAAAAATSAASLASLPSDEHWGNGGWGGPNGPWHWSSSAPAPAPATTTEAPAPPTTTEAPAPPATTEQPASPPETTAWAEPSSTPAPVSSSAPAPTGSSGSSYQDIALYHHNIHRANHSVSDLTWDSTLADTAMLIAQGCKWEHNMTVNGGGYGQNIAAGVAANNISEIITGMFYNGEEPFYTYYDQSWPSLPPNFESWGHFSQLVWAGTTSVGCATYECSTLEYSGSDVPPYFTVCNYGPPGNVEGAFQDNVKSPLGQPTAQWNTGM